jgi:4-hydroxybenzoate polyprenyltransferase
MLSSKTAKASKELLGLIRIARPLNLGIAAMAMVAMRYGLHDRLLVEGVQCRPLIFTESMLVMVLLMAAGNLINDYFDIREDRINHPERKLIGQDVPRRDLIKAHATLSIAALALAAQVAMQTGVWTVSILGTFIAGLLWWYSSSLKGRFVWGNLLVAGLTGLVPLWAALPELAGATYSEQWDLIRWSIAFGGMAFGVSWVREVIKDIRDIPGDTAAGHHTMAVEWGAKRSIRATLTGQWVVLLLYGSAGLWWSLSFSGAQQTGAGLTLSEYVALAVPGLSMAVTTVLLSRAKRAHEEGTNTSLRNADFAAKVSLVVGFLAALAVPI